MTMNEGHLVMGQMALAFFLGVLVSGGPSLFATKVTTTFGHLVLAWFIGFVLAHMVTKYLDRQDRRGGTEPFDRFPPPLVEYSPAGQGMPYGARGRDYIPHTKMITVGPGPLSPAPHDDFDMVWDAAPTSWTPQTPGPTLKARSARRWATSAPSYAQGMDYAPKKTLPRPSNATITTSAPRRPRVSRPPRSAGTTFNSMERWTLPYQMAEDDPDM